MLNPSIHLIAFQEAKPDVYQRGQDLLKRYLPDLSFKLTDSDPEILFILTGGSENQAKSIVDNIQHVLILAMNENNSFAAATEIKAYCNQKNIKSILINLDSEKDAGLIINNYILSVRAVSTIRNYNLGLIGNVSKWLIASGVQNEIIKSKFGINFVKIDWDNFKNFSEYPVNEDFINHFRNSKIDLKDSSKVYNLLINIITTHKLNAITVECFPMVREHAVTACLALSKFNDDLFPAGCEGDLTSIIGMIISKELTGQIPWMANLTSITKETASLAHCTISTNQVNDFNITTHFETNSGTAIQGHFKSKEVTIFRLDNNLKNVFITTGTVINTPCKNDACRTQIEIQLSEKDLNLLKEKPLGNHHLVLPGNYKDILEFFCKMNNVKVI
jgi:L-fucose isomerase-like protein